MTSSLQIQKRENILFLGIDSPNSTVNVLTRTMAQEIVEVFERLETRGKESEEISLVVFWSRKPYSFLNGAELLLTNHIKSEEDMERLTHTTRLAYQKVASSRIPTVAAIEGNCYGCGMEFALCCDYRVASDSYDTHFYMTELNDYHCFPIFGGMEKLPRLVGIKPSVDLLLGGDIWWAQKAKASGLIDDVLSASNFFEKLSLFLENLLKVGPTKNVFKYSASLLSLEHQDISFYHRNVLEKIGSLPPEKQPLYRQGLDIIFSALTDAGQPPKPSPNLFLAAASSHATSFFFIRNMAKYSSLGTLSTIPDHPVTLSLGSRFEQSSFGKILRTRKLRDLTIQTCEEPESFFLHSTEKRRQYSLKVVWGYSSDPVSENDEVVMYFPFKEESRICEVYLKKESVVVFRPFLLLLEHLGWMAIVVSEKESVSLSVVNLLLKVYFDYVESYLNTGGHLEDLNYSLWSFGFEKFPYDLASHCLPHKKEGWIRDYRTGKPDLQGVEVLLSSLYQEGLQLIQSKFLKHNSQLDLILREVFGYPIIRQNFSRMMAQMKSNASIPIKKLVLQKSDVPQATEKRW